MLLRMLQWMVTTGKPEICQLVVSLNHFGAYPREGHLDLDVRDFGYVKQPSTRKLLFTPGQ